MFQLGWSQLSYLRTTGYDTVGEIKPKTQKGPPHNHMTPHLSLSSKLKPTPHPFNIRTTDGSTMHGHNIGFILISNHSIPRVFHVPNHSYHLFSMG